MFNIKSWCQKVLDLLDLTFADLLGQNYMEHLGNFNYFLGLCILDGQFANFFCAFLKISIFSSTKGGNRWIIDETVDFMEYSRYFQRIHPSQANSCKE